MTFHKQKGNCSHVINRCIFAAPTRLSCRLVASDAMVARILSIQLYTLCRDVRLDRPSGTLDLRLHDALMGCPVYLGTDIRTIGVLRRQRSVQSVVKE